ncbi:Prevent host death protein (modular protein) [uncultured spirochete]|jgi:prevent-host-death family protein|uniref:Antitoxin n=1 Tax=uncultured spirochete TaxID=156406 RepID=A0A3P3XRQ7_9SPIR|nr:Prevent host death protein (modular protein) [uncultured spirochete]
MTVITKHYRVVRRIEIRLTTSLSLSLTSGSVLTRKLLTRCGLSPRSRSMGFTALCDSLTRLVVHALVRWRSSALCLTFQSICGIIYALEDKMAINLKEDIKPISYIKTNAADMMKYVTEVKNPIVITQNGEAKAVLLDIESYQNIQNAFSLLKILQLSEKQIEKGHYKSSEQVFDEIETRLSLKQ